MNHNNVAIALEGTAAKTTITPFYTLKVFLNDFENKCLQTTTKA